MLQISEQKAFPMIIPAAKCLKFYRKLLVRKHRSSAAGSSSKESNEEAIGRKPTNRHASSQGFGAIS